MKTMIKVGINMIEKREINGVTIRFTDESKELPSVVAVSTVRIAKIFEKEHKEVLRNFRNHIQYLEASGIKSPTSEMPLYADIEYIDSQGKKRKAMAVSERLFYQVVLSWNTKKSRELRVEFVNAFFDMRLQLMEATVAFQNRSSGQRDRRRKELKQSHKEEVLVLEEKVKERNRVIAECMALLQDEQTASCLL